jgi:hypothetical protein
MPTAFAQDTSPERPGAGNGQTTSQKLVTTIAWTRRGVRKFEDEVNQHLNAGWAVHELSIDKHGLRFVCAALLDKC